MGKLLYVCRTNSWIEGLPVPPPVSRSQDPRWYVNPTRRLTTESLILDCSVRLLLNVMWRRLGCVNPAFKVVVRQEEFDLPASKLEANVIGLLYDSTFGGNFSAYYPAGKLLPGRSPSHRVLLCVRGLTKMGIPEDKSLTVTFTPTMEFVDPLCVEGVYRD